jgi:di/tripeptidase
MSKIIRDFMEAVRLKRPHGSYTLAHYKAKLARRIKATAIDDCGNIHLSIGNSRTLFVAHLDTVHYEEGPNLYERSGDFVRAKEAPLGADDGAGIAVLLHLIRNKVPGYYIFTVGEECGGVGSQFIAQEYWWLLGQFERAIAFDRAGTSEVITHQGIRTASDGFAYSLADCLNECPDLLYEPSNRGVYTDTKEFADYIPECTNISVGYQFQHGRYEVQDLVHLVTLAEAVVKIDWEGLPTYRDCKKARESRILKGVL